MVLDSSTSRVLHNSAKCLQIPEQRASRKGLPRPTAAFLGSVWNPTFLCEVFLCSVLQVLVGIASGSGVGTEFTLPGTALQPVINEPYASLPVPLLSRHTARSAPAASHHSPWLHKPGTLITPEDPHHLLKPEAFSPAPPPRLSPPFKSSPVAAALAGFLLLLHASLQSPSNA